MASSSRVIISIAAAALLLAATAGVLAAQPALGGCVTCHRDLPEAALSEPARQFGSGDIHHERGFTCVDCHGGDAATIDKDQAKSAAAGYHGRPVGLNQVRVCSRCHSDAEFMRRYAPRQRVDQEVEYASSVHGQRLAEGDTNVATCSSCHGAHPIRRVRDALSPVFPLNVAGMCATCHGDTELMRDYTLPDGSPLPTDQHALYQKSVHYEALAVRSDLSSPTCNDCHGNHGAAPPGVGDVVNVCGTCHTIFATRFALSTHSYVFDRGCVECHGNHDILQPSDEMLGTDSVALCGACHGEGEPGFEAARTMRSGIERLKNAIETATADVNRASQAGMEMGDATLALREAVNHLTLARTEVHTFDVALVDAVLEEGLTTVAAVEETAEAAFAELRFRRLGLGLSLAAILLVVAALAYKVRTLPPPAGRQT